MPYSTFRMGGGMQLKAAADAVPDDGLRVCRYCSFDEVGTVASAKGRLKANDDLPISGSNAVLRGFDGLIGSNKKRYIKAAGEVYTGTVSATTPLDSTYTTAFGTLATYFLGSGTTPAFGSTSQLSGFTYNGYAYFADGSAMGRYNHTGDAKETWGLISPGYHEFSGAKANPLAINTAVDADLVTVTVAGNHGLEDGIGTNSFPFEMNIELVGMKTIAGIPENEINCLHFGGSGALGDISVVSDGAGDGTMAGGARYTIRYINAAGGFDWAKVNVDQTPDGDPLDGGSINSAVITQGGDGVDEVQEIWFNGTVTDGNFKLKFSREGGDFQTTADIPYDATAAEVQAACEALDFFNAAATTSFVCSVINATQFTFEVPTDGTGGSITGGGDIGFMRQGPTLASATGGALVAGTYYYAYTFYNGVAESNFSAQVPIAVSTGAAVTLTNVMRGPAGTTERRIYRTDVNGRQLYEVGRLTDNTTTTYTDTAKLPVGADYSAKPGDAVTDAENPAADADRQAGKKKASKRSIREREASAKAAAEKQRQKLATNLGLLSDWTDHDPPPTNIKHVGMMGETCFGISGSDLVFSSPGNPEHFPLSNRITPGRNVSETLRAWVPFDREVICYTDVALYRLTQVGLSFEDSRFEEIESPVGCAGEWAVAALDGQQGHVFLSKSGLYLFDGARVNEISYPIEPLFTDSGHEDYIRPEYMSQAIMEMSRDRMFLSYRSANSAGNNDRLLIADFQDLSNPKFTVLDWALTSLWRERTDNSLLAGDASSTLWVLDNGWSATTGSQVWEVTTKEFALNGTKAFRVDEVVLDADFAGATTSIVVSTRLRGSTKSATFSSTASGRQRLKFKLPQYCKGEVVQVAISSSSNAKRALYAVGFTWLPIGIPEDQP